MEGCKVPACHTAQCTIAHAMLLCVLASHGHLGHCRSGCAAISSFHDRQLAALQRFFCVLVVALPQA